MHVERAELELESLVARLERHELHPRGDTTRPGGWDEARQQRFIDTILRDWWVPEIHLAADTDHEVVLDGGERLLTLQRFFHDELPCSGEQAPDPGEPDDVRRLDGLRYSDLPGEVRRRVRRFRITVVVLSDYRPAELRELLDRLHPADEPEVAVPRPRAPAHRAPPFSLEPIYDQVSSWFADLSEFRSLSEAPGTFSSPADEGQAAAEAAVHPDRADLAGVTAAGLPQREPRALLVPGAVPPPAAGPLSFGASVPSPEDVAESLASYRDGVVQGSSLNGDDPPTEALPHPMFDDGAGVTMGW